MNSLALPRLRIVVLAAGFSSRLGKPKALARVRGSSLLRRTLELVADLKVAQVIAVIPRNAARYRAEGRGLDVAFAANSQRALGLSSSVRCGIAKARYSSALLLLPVDLINLKKRELARLIARWRAAPRCVIARRIGAAAGTPLILPRCLYTRMSAVTGDVGLRDLVGQLAAESRVLVDVPSALLDVDTCQDLHAARRRLRRQT
jgi:molybdenum cofactor cytidylyltransferase